MTEPNAHSGATGEFLDVSIGEFLRRSVRQAPQRPALICAESGKTWTYEALLAASEQAAHALLQRFQPGDHVATWGLGSTDFLQLHLGAALAGIVLVTLNPANRVAELEYMLTQSQACGLFLDRTFRQMDNKAILEELALRLPKLHSIVYMDEWLHFVSNEHEDPLPDVRPDEPALILFTSGTTGKPKAAMLRHSSVVNNARLTSDCLGLSPGSVWLNLLPLFHIGGSATITLGCFANLGTQVFLPAFDPDQMLASIERYRVNVTMAVPTMLVGMLQSEQLASTDTRSLHLIVTGGAVVSPPLVREVKEVIGAEVMTLFGQTEASGTMCVTRPGDDIEHVTLTVGAPLPLSRIRIVSATGGALPTGEVGEICLHSPCTMIEYFDMPEQTASTIDAEGWLHTGDMGYLLPDGYVQITGRLKEMIIRGGENIYPREIEDHLAAHPAVAQSAVFGVADEKWGEQVAAAVILRPGQAADKDALVEFLRARIARHKVPKIWLFLDSFPINASGKVQKFMLKEQLPGENV